MRSVATGSPCTRAAPRRPSLAIRARGLPRRPPGAGSPRALPRAGLDREPATQSCFGALVASVEALRAAPDAPRGARFSDVFTARSAPPRQPAAHMIAVAPEVTAFMAVTRASTKCCPAYSRKKTARAAALLHRPLPVARTARARRRNLVSTAGPRRRRAARVTRSRRLRRPPRVAAQAL